MSGVFDSIDETEALTPLAGAARRAIRAVAAAGALAVLLSAVVLAWSGAVSPALAVTTAAAALALVFVVALRTARSLERRLETVREARSAQSLEEVGRISATLAHELRNPLAALKGNMQLLAGGLEVGSANRDEADLLVEDVLHLEQRIEGLLRFVRSGRIERGSCELSRLLAAVVARVDDERVTVEASDVPARWHLDGERMEVVLENLVRNAVQVSPADATVLLAASQEREGLVFRVSDRGPGLPGGDPEELFQPFVTRRPGGTGLGLAIARQVVLAHRGRIHAQPRKGGGTVFVVEIPNG
jgi:signal transduction histidine kinase